MASKVLLPVTLHDTLRVQTKPVRLRSWLWLTAPAPPVHPSVHPSLHPSVQPAAPAAVSKQMSERVPTDAGCAARTPRGPGGLGASSFSREASLSAASSRTVSLLHQAASCRTTCSAPWMKKKKSHGKQRKMSPNLFKKKLKSKCHMSPKHL